MKAAIISYTLEKTKPQHRVAIQRLLYGYEDLSNNGSYHYSRKGLLDRSTAIKLNRGVLLAPYIEAKAIQSALEKQKATVHLVPVEVAKSLF